MLVGSEDVVKNGIGVLDKGGSWTSGQRGKKMKIKKSRTKLDPCQIILGLRHRKGRDPEGTTPGAVVLVGSEDVVKNGIGVLDKGGSWTSGQRGKKMKIKKSRTKLDPRQIVI